VETIRGGTPPQTAFGRTVAKIAHRLRTHGLMAHLLGLIVRMRFDKAGIVVAGWPPPEIANRGGRIEIENCTLEGGVRFECWRGAVIRIGNGTYLNRGVEIVAGRSVTIGQGCALARDVIVMDTDQHPIEGDEPRIRTVIIGDRVWIGARATILKGVSLGHDCVVGAGAIVTKDVPPYAVVVGNPAREIYSKRNAIPLRDTA
jgi:acetyltransferase-like isoleucine patch superfamily enzyme